MMRYDISDDDFWHDLFSFDKDITLQLRHDIRFDAGARHLWLKRWHIFCHAAITTGADWHARIDALFIYLFLFSAWYFITYQFLSL